MKCREVTLQNCVIKNIQTTTFTLIIQLWNLVSDIKNYCSISFRDC
jgi:hypothetical protein